MNAEINDNLFDFEKYQFQNALLDVHIVSNNLSNLFFATKGSLFKTNVMRSIYNNATYLSSNGGIAVEDRKTNNFTKLMASYQKRIPFNSRLAIIVETSVNFIFQDKITANQLPFDTFGIGAHYYLGGYLPGTRINNLVFPGLNENDVPVTQAIKAHIKLQTNPFHNIYISPHFNYASIGFSNFNEYIKSAFLPDGNWSESFAPSSLISIGTTVSYNSILGPVNLDISLLNDTGKVRGYFGAGLFLQIAD